MSPGMVVVARNAAMISRMIALILNSFFGLSECELSNNQRKNTAMSCTETSRPL